MGAILAPSGCGLRLRLSPGPLFLSGGGGWAWSQIRDENDTLERRSATRRPLRRPVSGGRRLLGHEGGPPILPE